MSRKLKIRPNLFRVRGGLLGGAGLFSFESKCLVGHKTPEMHLTQNRHLGIKIVIDPDAAFASVISQRSSDVLNDFPLERDRERKKESIDSRAVEPLT